MGRQVSPTILLFILLLFVTAVIYYVGTSSVGLSLAKGFQQSVYAVTGRDASGKAVGYPNIPAGQQPNPISVNF